MMPLNFVENEWLFLLEEPELIYELYILLRDTYGYALQYNELGQFIYGEGTIPIMLVAHVDTVHKFKPTFTVYDDRHHVVWAPDGIGADDRAGVWAILELLKRGYRPHVLFTDEEESGCRGAKAAVKVIDADFSSIKYIIELDRKGSKDAVFYQCDNPLFTQYINDISGYVTASGSCSDISTLCPAWKIAGVNLSVGYYSQHTNSEVLFIDELEHTVDVVAYMLENPPDAQFEYIEKKYVYKTYDYRKRHWNQQYNCWMYAEEEDDEAAYNAFFRGEDDETKRGTRTVESTTQGTALTTTDTTTINAKQTEKAAAKIVTATSSSYFTDDEYDFAISAYDLYSVSTAGTYQQWADWLDRYFYTYDIEIQEFVVEYLVEMGTPYMLDKALSTEEELDELEEHLANSDTLSDEAIVALALNQRANLALIKK